MPIEHQNSRPRQHSRVQLEARIFGRGADQRDCSVFHIRQKAILLRAVEPMDFVDKQKRPAPRLPADFGSVERLAQFSDTGKNRRQLLELEIGLVRQQTRHRRLATTRWTPKDHALQVPSTQHASERALRSNEVILPRHIGEAFWPQPIRQRSRCAFLNSSRFEQIGHAAGRLGHPCQIEKR